MEKRPLFLINTHIPDRFIDLSGWVVDEGPTHEHGNVRILHYGTTEDIVSKSIDI